jgi:hypothetical protein
MIAAEGLGNMTIRQGETNVLGLNNSNSVQPSYRIDGDTLKVLASPNNDRQSVSVTVRDMSLLTLKHVDDCNVIGVRRDSLNILGDGSGEVDIDSSGFHALRLQLGVGCRVTFSNGASETLRPELDSNCTLSLQNARVRRIAGSWKPETSLQIDAATLSNGIEKIENIH